MARKYTRRSLFCPGGSQEGSTTIEYGLLAALLSVALLGLLQAIGADVARPFRTIRRAIRPPPGNSGGNGNSNGNGNGNVL